MRKICGVKGKMDKMRVSIITPCLNSESTIKQTIESVLNQTYRNIEYIVIDGGSEDRTLDIIREYIPKFNGRLKCISEKDKGIYDAMNKGIKQSTGKLIGIIGSDDYYEIDAVEKAVFHMTNEAYQVIYGYGVWIIDNSDGKDFAYFQGCDPGVSFISEYNPDKGIISVLVSNYGDNVWREMRKIREVFY